MQNQKPRTTLYYIIYAIGATLGIAFITLSTWADLEATFYGFFHRTNTRFGGLDCPIFMTPNETSSFSATITNTTDRPLSPAVKVEISTRAAPYSTIERLSLEPGESKRVTWEIGPDNIDIGHFAFAQVYVYSFYPIGDSENNCGIFVLNLPGNGTIFTWGSIVLSLIGMGFGLYQLSQIRKRLFNKMNILPALIFLCGVIVVGLIVCLVGSWVQGVLILVVITFLLLIIAGLVITHRENHPI